MRKVLLEVGFVAALLIVSGPAWPQEIVLVLSSGASQYQEVADGFRESFSGSLREFNLEGSDQRQMKVGKELQASKPAAVVVVGDLAAQMAKWYLSEVPVIYCDSVRAAKFSLTEQQAVGIYHEPEPSQQLKALHELFPDKKTVGLVYSPDYSKISESQLKADASAMGITIEAAAMGTIKDVPGKLQALLPKIDLLWVFTDPVVLSQHSVQFIVLQTISAGLPIFCGNNGLAHGGATAALVPDLADAGEKAAREADRILNGVRPRPGSVIYPAGQLVLNRKTASLLKLSFPEGVVSKAREIIE